MTDGQIRLSSSGDFQFCHDCMSQMADKNYLFIKKNPEHKNTTSALLTWFVQFCSQFSFEKCVRYRNMCFPICVYFTFTAPTVSLVSHVYTNVILSCWCFDLSLPNVGRILYLTWIIVLWLTHDIRPLSWLKLVLWQL